MSENIYPKIYSIHSHYDKKKKNYYLGMSSSLFRTLSEHKLKVTLEDSFFKKSKELDFSKTVKSAFKKTIDEERNDEIYFFIGK